MTTRCAWVLGIAVLVAGCGGAAGTGKVSGTVAFADGTPATGVALALQGQTVLAATTDGTGHFAFTKVAEGGYVLSADVPGTLERHAQVVVSVGKSPVTVPTLTFTAVGTVSGTVTDSAGDPAGAAEVRILGTDRAASTDATGAFTVTQVPTGAQAVMASSGTGAGRVTGTAEVTVKRGAAATASLTLAAPPAPPPPPAPGTVTGTVTYPLTADASTITVTAMGTTTTAHPDPDGSFSLSLPPGAYRIDVSATHYPTQTLGQARVTSGETVALPPKEMSMYRPLPGNGDTAWSTAQAGSPPADVANLAVAGRALLYRQGPTGVWLYAVDLDTLALHPIASLDGPPSVAPALGPKGKQVAVFSGGSVYVTSIDTQTVTATPVDVGNATQLDFGQDGKVLLVAGPGGVDRLDLATGQMTSVSGTGFLRVGPHAFLVGTSDALGLQTRALVTDAGVTPKVFDGVAAIFSPGLDAVRVAQPVLAVTYCPGPGDCPVLDLPEGATATVPVTLPDGSPFTATAAANLIARGEGTWLLLTGPTGLYLLDSDTGKTVAVPLDSPQLWVSPDGSELAFIDQARTGMYVGLANAPFAGTEVHGTNLRGTFVSGDTFVAFDDSTPARRLVFQGGAAPTVDTDYASGSGRLAGSMALWTRPSTGNLAARIGASAAVDLPFAASNLDRLAGSPFDPATGRDMDLGAVSSKTPVVTYVLDGGNGTLRSYPGLRLFAAFGAAFGGTDLGGQMIDLPAGGGDPVPLTAPGLQPQGGTILPPSSTLVIASSPGGPGQAFGIGIFPGYEPLLGP